MTHTKRNSIFSTSTVLGAVILVFLGPITAVYAQAMPDVIRAASIRGDQDGTLGNDGVLTPLPGLLFQEYAANQGISAGISQTTAPSADIKADTATSNPPISSAEHKSEQPSQLEGYLRGLLSRHFYL